MSPTGPSISVTAVVLISYHGARGSLLFVFERDLAPGLVAGTTGLEYMLLHRIQ